MRNKFKLFKYKIKKEEDERNYESPLEDEDLDRDRVVEIHQDEEEESDSKKQSQLYKASTISQRNGEVSILAIAKKTKNERSRDDIMHL